MATEQSLFGATPESLQLARDAALNTEAASYAQMDPFQRATFGIYKGANQLGGAVGGMLGGTDPQMIQMQKRQELIKGVDLNDPASLKQAIERAMSANDFPATRELSARLQALLKSGLEGRKTEADIAASESTVRGKLLESTLSLQGQADRVNTLTEAGIPAAQAAGIASNPAAFAQALKEKNVVTPPEYGAAAGALGYPVNANMAAYTPEQMTAMSNFIDKRKTSVAAAGRMHITVPIGEIFDKMASTTDAKTKGEDFKTAGAAYAMQVPMQFKLNSVLSSLPTTTTGSLSDIALSAGKLASAFGIPVDEKRLTNAEYLNSVSSQVIQLIAKNFPGSQSDRELKELQKSKFNLGQQIPTIIRIIKDIQMENGANMKTYERMSRLPEQERYRTDPRLMAGQIYKDTQLLSTLEQKIANRTATREEAQQALDLRKELK